MSSESCPRLFEAEAMRDGRLARAELASFERHMSACPACLREVRALERLAEAVRASGGERDGADELHVRRERIRLLAAFDRALVVPERRAVARRSWLWPAAGAALLAGTFVLWHVQAVVQSVRRLTVVVRADSTALWSRRTQDDRERIALERGALFIHVDHSHSSQARRLVVVLPDGELEDTGTTFTVSVKDGHTARVAVQDGSVVLRIRGQAPLAFGPGETWTADSASAACPLPTPKASPGEQRVAAAPTVPRDCSRSLPLAAPRRRLPLRVSRSAFAAALPSSAPAHQSDAALDFRAAMAAFDSGDHRTAAARFATFLALHAEDSRAEDAAYLRIIALDKCGDQRSMQSAALDYLQRYPRGFRCSEVEQLVRTRSTE